MIGTCGHEAIVPEDAQEPTPSPPEPQDELVGGALPPACLLPKEVPGVPVAAKQAR